eukprot:gi/632952176/ref/XP_007891712.1/ PREDICTED: uncharacterized protein C7orf62 homolog isoform X2 [Callorhinchus milii]
MIHFWKFILHRFVYITQYNSANTNRRKVSDYYETLFHRIQAEHQEETLTGLMLLHPTCAVHLLESSTDRLYAVIRDLARTSEGDQATMKNTKILVLSHNIPSRLFQQWHGRIINLPVTLLMDNIEQEPMDKLVPECLSLLLKLGVHLLANPKKAIIGMNDSVAEEVRHLIIKENTINYLCERPEFDTPQQFLEVYDKPVYVLQESELVWPAPHHLYSSG